jgi:hypothetical protein
MHVIQEISTGQTLWLELEQYQSISDVSSSFVCISDFFSILGCNYWAAVIAEASGNNMSS